MKGQFSLSFDPIEGSFDDAIEQATFARLWIGLEDRLLSRSANKRTGVRDYLKLPLHQLARGLASNWWTLLYEPWRSEEATPRRIARHSLDSFTAGYTFPSVGLWSAGDEALTIETGAAWRFSEASNTDLAPEELEIARQLAYASPVSPRSLSRIEFVDENRDRVTVARAGVEDQFYDLVTTVLEWIGTAQQSDVEFLERWERVTASIAEPAERNYCMAAGRLGFDPYDPETPDISIFAAELPEESFDDLCNAARFDELADAAAWISVEQQRLDKAPTMNMSSFGTRPSLDPTLPAWMSGYRAAVELRRTLSLNDDPRRATSDLIGATQASDSVALPVSVEGLVLCQDGNIHSLVQYRSTAQWRFRECRAAYLGWGAESDSYPLLTTAATHRQQASRAFAAEMVCPADYLRHKAGRHGLTADQMIEISEMLDCQTIVVDHQARNHGIPTRGLF